MGVVGDARLSAPVTVCTELKESALLDGGLVPVGDVRALLFPEVGSKASGETMDVFRARRGFKIFASRPKENLELLLLRGNLGDGVLTVLAGGLVAAFAPEFERERFPDSFGSFPFRLPLRERENI